MYCSTASLKAYLDIDSAADDTLLLACIDRAKAMIDAHCRRTFEATADTTRYYDPTIDARGARLYLDKDLCAITSITNGDGEVVAAADYVTEPRNSVDGPAYAITLRSQSGLAWTYDDDSENAISIVGRWAYATTAPNDIVQACIRTAAWLYKQRDGAFGQTARPEVGIIETPLALPPDIKSILQPYRRVRIEAL